MKPLNLEDIRPQEAKFYIKSMDHEFTIRPITLADEAWLRQTFSEDKINEALRTEEGMARFVFQCLTQEDKALFKAKDLEVIDENGETKKIRIGGWKLLMQSVEGMAEKVAMSRALLQARGFSAPILDEIMAHELKKKVIEERNQNQLVGEQSLTSSQVSTDGPLTTSGNSQGEKSA